MQYYITTIEVIKPHHVFLHQEAMFVTNLYFILKRRFSNSDPICKTREIYSLDIFRYFDLVLLPLIWVNKTKYLEWVYLSCFTNWIWIRKPSLQIMIYDPDESLSIYILFESIHRCNITSRQSPSICLSSSLLASSSSCTSSSLRCWILRAEQHRQNWNS